MSSLSFVVFLSGIKNWTGTAGQKCREVLSGISAFVASKRIDPDHLADLGAAKLEGLAYKEYADAVKTFQEAEKIRVEAELVRLTMESRKRKEAAEADSAELNNLEKQAELMRKLNDIGVMFAKDHGGRYVLLPKPQELKLKQVRFKKITVSGKKAISKVVSESNKKSESP